MLIRNYDENTKIFGPELNLLEVLYSLLRPIFGEQHLEETFLTLFSED